jgi:hypothetical protein
MAQQPLDHLRDHLISLIYATRLQEIGIQQSPAEFRASNMEGLVRAGCSWLLVGVACQTMP